MTLTAPTDKHLAIIELREQRLTYQEVGERAGVTKQYVEQVLKRWRPDLAFKGFAPAKPTPRIEKHCELCNTEFGSRLLPYAAKRRRYCSISCSARANQGSKYTASEMALAALEMRPKGKTWNELAVTFGITPGSVIRACLAHERRTGTDMSAAFPGRRKVYSRKQTAPGKK